MTFLARLHVVLKELLSCVLVPLCSPSGVWEALLPVSGRAFRREIVCVALMVKYVRLKRPQLHMRIWLCRGWSSWLLNLSESFLDSRKAENLGGFSGHRGPWITPELHWSAEELGLDVGHSCDAPVGVICGIKMSLIAEDWWQLCSVCDSSQRYVHMLELNTIILQKVKKLQQIAWMRTLPSLTSMTSTTLTYFSLFWIRSTMLIVPQERRNSGFRCQGQTANRPNDPSMMFVLQYVLDHLPFLSGVYVGKQPAAGYGDTGSGLLCLWWLSCWKQAAVAERWCCHHCSEAVSQTPGQV